MENPLQQVLLDLAQARDKFNTELLRAPAPGPLKQAMQEVDKILSQAETDIRNTFRNMPKPPFPEEVDNFLRSVRFSDWMAKVPK